jgi:hypothetical protein
MFILIVGITLLVAHLFPFGSQIVGALFGGMYGPSFGGGSPVIFHTVMLVANYIPAAIVAVVFVRKSELSRRIGDESAGRTAITIGLVLTLLYLAPRLFASSVPGGGAAFAVSMFAPYFLIPAKIFVVYGVTKQLLAASPR